jgi:hypothetical protein
LIEHDLFEKPVSTFPDHALDRKAAALHRLSRVNLPSFSLPFDRAASSSLSGKQLNLPECAMCRFAIVLQVHAFAAMRVAFASNLEAIFAHSIIHP